ncbi:diguanylate cyclase domain-containing protein [Treponema zioleckii]|uniref:diguanylate cyclase domain-containing protein n=1 Tax=Treponema zioleckii TaxID=331680 RepID=UPI00168BC0BD|nr:diguanylate cyclase [Treponema zioleckii]
MPKCKKNQTGIFNFSIGDESRIVVYTPVWRNDWYVISTITSDYIFLQQKKITKITVRLIFMVSAVFMIIILFLSRMMILRARLEKDNSRYAINYETSQTLIFDYDFEKKMIEFTGNTSFLFGENIKSIPLSDFKKIESRVHESEKGVLLKIKDFLSGGGTRYISELRLLCKNNEYIWYRITGNIIRDKENVPLKFIGNAVNVNAQIMHEQELKTMVETDGLSGLLNKVYMEKSVSKFIEESGGTEFAAFFIIDLDNFKLVNDKLGHSYGDQAICDTANKLSLVFSERDFIGRIGGDEFCVFLCVKSSVKNPMQIVEKKAKTLRDILSEDYTNGDVSVHVTASIGISLFPNQATLFKSLFKMADTALYHVKNNGKNNFAIFDEDMQNHGESVYE